jgi:hypothetical protein
LQIERQSAELRIHFHKIKLVTKKTPDKETGGLSRIIGFEF